MNVLWDDISVLWYEYQMALTNARSGGRDAQFELGRVENTYRRALQEFADHGEDRISILKQATGASDRRLMADVARVMPVEELKSLLPELVLLASWLNNALFAVREAILRLPRDWVAANIYLYMEPLLGDESDEEYYRFLELARMLNDPVLFRRIIERLWASKLPFQEEIEETFEHSIREIFA